MCIHSDILIILCNEGIFHNNETAILASAILDMSANPGNSAVATGLEKVSFHSNPKEEQFQRMLKLAYKYAHFTC